MDALNLQRLYWALTQWVISLNKLMVKFGINSDQTFQVLRLELGLFRFDLDLVKLGTELNQRKLVPCDLHFVCFNIAI